MRCLILLAAILALAGCKSEGERAEQRYEIVKSEGTASDRCAAANAVADAYLQAEDSDNFGKWRAVAAMECVRARVEAGR